MKTMARPKKHTISLTDEDIADAMGIPIDRVRVV
jgi:ABC-type Fe3+-siderophore transport system permease subunit